MDLPTGIFQSVTKIRRCHSCSVIWTSDLDAHTNESSPVESVHKKIRESYMFLSLVICVGQSSDDVLLRDDRRVFLLHSRSRAIGQARYLGIKIWIAEKGDGLASGCNFFCFWEMFCRWGDDPVQSGTKNVITPASK
jgi:hypothetical protein